MSSHRHFALSALTGALACALASALASCASSSSTFNSTWTNPTAAPAGFAGRKVLAVVQVQEEGRRPSAEDVLAAEITKRGALGVPSYTLFASSGPGSETLNPAKSDDVVRELVATVAEKMQGAKLLRTPPR